ncbi:hypothetical protein FVEN_g12681 [Fusarium venenatum]|uniref:Extracellular membrane protein CFEM domain-containing protein n=1 Tax=Fusarium venenatum TaxID=56646 RepID=A0A2L2SVX8_9HYPO|nr:uncharacterized protein FVRRES_12646 [Fusarium venenatum]KAG8360550.1 hypothetical protein FVEN_g12681 [Fusarium venenatum]CEI39955.1 unnamed protein product [Fusarium venenatum]
MISNSFFSAALTILAINSVQAGPCRPTSALTTETSLTIESTATETILTTKGETSELSVATTEISVTTTEVTTTAPFTTTTEISVSISEANTSSEDISTAEDTTTMPITTTMETLQSTTTSALATTTNAASGGGDSCVDNVDCLLSMSPLCALGLCVCIDAICAPPAGVQSSNLDLCTALGICSCVNGVCRL